MNNLNNNNQAYASNELKKISLLINELMQRQINFSIKFILRSFIAQKSLCRFPMTPLEAIRQFF